MSRSAPASSYAAVLRLEGAARAFSAAVVARLSYAMVTLTLLIVVQQATGSYASAGVAVAGYGLSGLAMPLKSRLVDRHGAAPVLPWLSAGSASCLLALSALAAAHGTAAGVYVVLATGAGLTAPPVGPSMRALWAALAPGPAARRRAYSLDGATEEVMFAVAPLLVGAVLLVASAPAAGVLTAALNVAGVCALVTSPASRTHDRGPRAATTSLRRTGPFARRGFVILLLVLLGFGLGTGPLEVGLLARTEQAGATARVGALLAVLSVGSAVGGLLWGRVVQTHRPRRHLGGLLAVSAVLLAALAATGHGFVLVGVLFLLGLVAAPVLVTAYLAADHLTDVEQQREASTWVNTANNLGVALGASGAGFLVDHRGPGPAFASGAAGCVLALLVVLLVGRRLDGAPGPGTGAD